MQQNTQRGVQRSLDNNSQWVLVFHSNVTDGKQISFSDDVHVKKKEENEVEEEGGKCPDSNARCGQGTGHMPCTAGRTLGGFISALCTTCSLPNTNEAAAGNGRFTSVRETMAA